MIEIVMLAIVELIAKKREDIGREYYAICIEDGKWESAI
jgi:hypothetical protein